MSAPPGLPGSSWSQVSVCVCPCMCVMFFVLFCLVHWFLVTAVCRLGVLFMCKQSVGVDARCLPEVCARFVCLVLEVKRVLCFFEFLKLIVIVFCSVSYVPHILHR